MVRAMPLAARVRLLLAGNFEDAELEQALRAEPGWAQVDYLGLIGARAVRACLHAPAPGW